jgi:Flp pilus assembly CpaE family ATPase
LGPRAESELLPSRALWRWNSAGQPAQGASADLDVNAGLVALIFGFDPRYSLLDVINNIHHLDYTCWEAMVNHGIDDLHILPSPGLQGHQEVSRDHIPQVLP